MSEMVERVARVLAENAAKRSRAIDPSMFDNRYGDVEAYVAERWSLYAADARAAIEAIRGPTGAMMDTAAAAWHAANETPERLDLGEYCACIYRAMIDAALKETA
jgi:hypothetical protein